LQLHSEELFQKVSLVAETAQDCISKTFESGRHFEDKHFAILRRRRSGIRIRNIEAEPEILQGRLVEENRDTLVVGMIGDTFAKQVAPSFEEYRFARFHHDLLMGKPKHFRSFGYENEGVFRHEYIARLLFDALMVFAEAEFAGLKEAAVRRFGKISWNTEQVRCR